MFSNCPRLTKVDLSSFNTQNVDNMINMFYGCESLTKVDLSSFNTKKGTLVAKMFYKCDKLIKINLPSFNTQNALIIDIFYVISDSENLNKIFIKRENYNKISKYNLNSVKNKLSIIEI